MCQSCACCHSPRVYCQHRTACLIDLLTKEGELKPCGAKARTDGSTGEDRQSSVP